MEERVAQGAAGANLEGKGLLGRHQLRDGRPVAAVNHRGVRHRHRVPLLRALRAAPRRALVHLQASGKARLTGANLLQQRALELERLARGRLSSHVRASQGRAVSGERTCARGTRQRAELRPGLRVWRSERGSAAAAGRASIGAGTVRVGGGDAKA